MVLPMVGCFDAYHRKKERFLEGLCPPNLPLVLVLNIMSGHIRTENQTPQTSSRFLAQAAVGVVWEWCGRSSGGGTRARRL